MPSCSGHDWAFFPPLFFFLLKLNFTGTYIVFEYMNELGKPYNSISRPSSLPLAKWLAKQLNYNGNTQTFRPLDRALTRPVRKFDSSGFPTTTVANDNMIERVQWNFLWKVAFELRSSWTFPAGFTPFIRPSCSCLVCIVGQNEMWNKENKKIRFVLLI